eukprot:Pgem_evm1s13757
MLQNQNQKAIMSFERSRKKAHVRKIPFNEEAPIPVIPTPEEEKKPPKTTCRYEKAYISIMNCTEFIIPDNVNTCLGTEYAVREH